MSRIARFALWTLASSILLAPAGHAEPASGSGVSIDWGALDALGPSKAHGPGVVLHKPDERQPAKPVKKVLLHPPAKHAARPAKPPEKPQETAAAPPPAAAPAQDEAPPPPKLTAIAPPPVKLASRPPPPPAPAQAEPAPERVSFLTGKSELSPEAQKLLDGVATRMSADATLRLELVAYAAGNGDDSIDARRLSRARAEAMRAYLVDKGVGVVRVDLRALGKPTDDGAPTDRVDLVFLEH